MYRSNQSFNIPPPAPGIPRAFDTFAVPGRREFEYQSLLGGGDPHAPLACLPRARPFSLSPTTSKRLLRRLWRAIMGDAVLEDFRGKDCAFVANWLQGKGLNKLCAVFEGI